MEFFLKLKQCLLPITILASSPLLANTLECPTSEGIGRCQKEAKLFCENSNYHLKKQQNHYLITCSKASTVSSEFSDKEEKLKTQEVVEQESSSASEASSQPRKYYGVIQQESKPAKLRLALGLGYLSSATVKADITAYNRSNGATVLGDIEMETESGISLNLEARYLRQNDWGLTAGIDIDAARDLESGTMTINGTTINSTASDDPDTLTSIILYGNLVYKFDHFYIPFGLNMAFVDYESTGYVIDSTPSIGIQFGIGYELDSNFAFELMARGTSYDLEYTDGSVEIRFEDALTTDVALRAKYIFF